MRVLSFQLGSLEKRWKILVCIKPPRYENIIDPVISLLPQITIKWWRRAEQEAKIKDEYCWKRTQENIEKLIDFWAHR